MRPQAGGGARSAKPLLHVPQNPEVPKVRQTIGRVWSEAESLTEGTTDHRQGMERSGIPDRRYDRPQAGYGAKRLRALPAESLLRGENP